MSDRAEPFLAERLWVHRSVLAATVGDPVTAFDDAGRPHVPGWELVVRALNTRPKYVGRLP